MRIEKVLELQSKYTSEAIQIYQYALEVYLTNSEITDRIVSKIYKDHFYYKMPRYSRSFVDGFIDALASKHWRNVVFAYVVDGKVLPIDSEEYKKIPATTIAKNYGHTCHFVYRSNPLKRYTYPECPHLRAKIS